MAKKSEPVVIEAEAEEVAEERSIVVAKPQSVTTWSGAAKRGMEARREREAIIAGVLISDVDYGTVPGVDKPFLFKSGAEKVTDALETYPDYVEMKGTVIDREANFWAFRYKCLIRQRGSDMVVATGIGSCNSHEVKYRYRKDERSCPECGKKGSIIKGKAEYGGGWLCWAKREGCGAKFTDADKRITEQSVERIENPDVFDQLNTGDKMAQKRALVAASLNLGFSDHFTQDPETVGYDEPQPTEARKTPAGEPQKAGDKKTSIEDINLLL